MHDFFTTATKAAIEDLISQHSTDSKFGKILSKESAEDLARDLCQMFMNSRQLKSAGDKFLAKAAGLG